MFLHFAEKSLRKWSLKMVYFGAKKRCWKIVRFFFFFYIRFSRFGPSSLDGHWNYLFFCSEAIFLCGNLWLDKTVSIYVISFPTFRKISILIGSSRQTRISALFMWPQHLAFGWPIPPEVTILKFVKIEFQLFQH